MRVHNSIAAIVLCLTLLAGSPAFAAKVPDIPTGSKIFLENKGTSDESLLFTELFREKLSRDETKRNYSKPGFPVVEKKEGADYTLRFIFVMRENARGFLESTQEHARVNVWLLDSKGTLVWEHNYDCIRVFREPARECYQSISDDLKAAQVNAEGKRAGLLGWRRDGSVSESSQPSPITATKAASNTAKAPPPEASGTGPAPISPASAPIQPASSPSLQQATVEFWSQPNGAGVELDGKYIGITPLLSG